MMEQALDLFVCPRFSSHGIEARLMHIKVVENW